MIMLLVVKAQNILKYFSNKSHDQALKTVFFMECLWSLGINKIFDYMRCYLSSLVVKKKGVTLDKVDVGGYNNVKCNRETQLLLKTARQVKYIS